MKMRRTIITLFAIFAAIGASAGTVTKSFNNLAEFSGIQISDSFKARLVQGDEFTAVVSIDSALEEFLEVNVIGSILYVRLKERDLNTTIRNIAKRKMEVTVTCPSLSQIHLTGASSLTSSDKWVSPMGVFTFETSGAASAKKLRIEGSELRATISGASDAGITGDFETVEISASGAAGLFLIGDHTEISANLSGASKVSLMGSADTIDATCSGTAFLDALEFKVGEAAIECGGASKANINVNEKLTVELTGASSCRYRSGNESLNVVPSVSRASSLKRVR